MVRLEVTLVNAGVYIPEFNWIYPGINLWLKVKVLPTKVQSLDILSTYVPKET